MKLATRSMASSGRVAHQKCPAFAHACRVAPGMRLASDCELANGITSSMSPLTTNVGHAILPSCLVELKRPIAASCPWSPAAGRFVSRNAVLNCRMSRSPRAPARCSSGSIIRMKVSTLPLFAFGSSELAHSCASIMKSTGGGVASRPPCVVQPRMSEFVFDACVVANRCAIMPPSEIPMTLTLSAPASTATECASSTISSIV
mmetsp:Transcript_49910/g.147154  ORF Transcript_49910/g.147154 Transcript_49910/m.147154 type:complete len:203 (-) Transcript_49910:119-727(-)